MLHYAKIQSSISAHKQTTGVSEANSMTLEVGCFDIELAIQMELSSVTQQTAFFKTGESESRRTAVCAVRVSVESSEPETIVQRTVYKRNFLAVSVTPVCTQTVLMSRHWCITDFQKEADLNMVFGSQCSIYYIASVTTTYNILQTGEGKSSAISYVSKVELQRV